MLRTVSKKIQFASSCLTSVGRGGLKQKKKKKKDREVDRPLIMNSVLATTQLIYSRRRIIKLITIRSGLEEGLPRNPSTNTLTVNLPEYSSVCANDHQG